MKRLFLAIALLLSLQSAFGSERRTFVYAAWNPLASLSFLKMNFITTSILPVFANLESGVALSCGYFQDGTIIEGRLSIGNSNYDLAVLQAQAGWYFFPGETENGRGSGFYAGASLRYSDVWNLYSGVHLQTLLPLASAGYRFDLGGGLFIDLRASELFAAFSWSSMEHSVPAAGLLFSPITGISPWMPLLSVDIGFRL